MKYFLYFCRTVYLFLRERPVKMNLNIVRGKSRLFCELRVTDWLIVYLEDYQD